MKALLAACVIAALAGCGGGESAAGLLAAAINNAQEAETFRSSFQVKADLDGDVFEMRGRQISNATTTRVRGSFRLIQDGEPFDAEMILIEDELWMRSPQLRDVLPRGKTWVHSSDPELAQQSLTPTQLVELMQEDPDVDEVGHQRIRGIDTVHIRGPLDIKEAAERVDGPVTDRLKRTPDLDRMHALMDLWIDAEQERLMRVAMKITVEGKPGSMQFSGDLLEEDVSLDTVKAPPEDRVAPESVLE